MTTFDDRDKSFENKFAHDEEVTFKVNARRNKLVGLWAAAKMGKTGPAADNYALGIIEADFSGNGSDDVIAQLMKDFATASIAVTLKEIRTEMEAMLDLARKQIMGEA